MDLVDYEDSVRVLLEWAVKECVDGLEERGSTCDDGAVATVSYALHALLERARTAPGLHDVFVQRDPRLEPDQVVVVVHGSRDAEHDPWDEEEDGVCADDCGEECCTPELESDEFETVLHLAPPGLSFLQMREYDEFRKYSSNGKGPLTPEEAFYAASSGWERVEDLTSRPAAASPVTQEGVLLRRAVTAAKKDGSHVTADVPVPLRSRLGDDVYRAGVKTLRTCTATPEDAAPSGYVCDEIRLYAREEEWGGSVWSSVFIPSALMTDAQAELYNRLRADGTPRREAEFFALNV